jgi:hypothetical protein
MVPFETRLDSFAAIKQVSWSRTTVMTSQSAFSGRIEEAGHDRILAKQPLANTLLALVLGPLSR